MADAFVVAIIAGGATVLAALLTLAGVFAGALLEPLKLRAAGRARARQERAERCAALVAAARDVHDNLLDFRMVYDRTRQAPDGAGVDRRQQLADGARTGLASLRAAAALVELSGPDDLGKAARDVRDASLPLFWSPRDQANDAPAWTSRLQGFEQGIDVFVRLPGRTSGSRGSCDPGRHDADGGRGGGGADDARGLADLADDGSELTLSAAGDRE